MSGLSKRSLFLEKAPQKFFGLGRGRPNSNARVESKIFGVAFCKKRPFS
jgi:hypothetical protein